MSHTWKEYGLKVNFSILPAELNNIEITYDMSLKTPSRSTSGSFQTNQMKSQVKIPIDQEFVVGALEYMTEYSNNKVTPFFDSVPIVAPLFKLMSSESLLLNLYLSFEVNEI